MGIEILVCAADIDESFPKGGGDFGALCCGLARRKVRAVLEKPAVKGRRWFLGADTVVVRGRRVIGKPGNREEAREFLGLLQGALHTVVTGVALYDARRKRFRLAAGTSRVRLAKMGKAEIEWYLDTGEWRGVAGAYRIQEKGAFFIEYIRGDYTNVMGLPMRLVYEILLEHGYPLGIKSSGYGRP
jgi:septum formation protein